MSSFAGHGKKTTWAVWNMLQDLTEALVKILSAREFIPGDILHTIERFVILVYDRTSTCTDIDKACRGIYATPCTGTAASNH